MKNRNPITVFFLSFLTIFIYSWYWLVKTKGEMNKLGEQIPTAWIWLIPFVGSIWWLWKYSEGVEHVTQAKLNGILAFIVLWLLGPIGNAIVQDSFNKVAPSVSSAPAAATPQPYAGVVSGQPTPSVTPTPQPPQPSDQNPQPPVTPPSNTPVIGG